jgi:glycosyltransferase involved in cell wall biosynthesis
MRILFLASRDGRDPKACGGDLCTTDSARYLAAKGHSVTLVVARYPGSQAREIDHEVQIVRLGGLFFLALRAFIFYVRHGRTFDVVYEEGLASLRLPYLAPLYVRKPIIAMWYQTHSAVFAEQFPRPVAWCLTQFELVLLWLHRRCKILTLSEERKRDLVALGVDERQVDLMPPLMLDGGISIAPAGKQAREPLIVWLGKVRRYKCPHHAVEAMPSVIERVPSARLMIAGRADDVEYERDLERLARRLGIAHAVEVHTNIDDDEKWQLLSRARAIVVTSPVEGFGIVIVEAGRCGTPAVVTDGVPAEVAEDGQNALRVPFGDRAAMAGALVRLLRDDVLFERLSTNAVRHAAKFSSDRNGERLQELFLDVSKRAA